MTRIFFTIALVLLPAAGSAASFNCDQEGLKPDEKAICDNRDLNDADVRMVTTFDLLTGLFAMGVRGHIQDDQTTWLKEREACKADVACIRDAYTRRQKQLDEVYSGIDRPL